MNEGEKRLLLAAAMAWVVPAVLLMVWKPGAPADKKELPEASEYQETTAPKPEVRLISVEQEDGGILEMELEDYIAGVVAAEMPASFEMEALKAQAVVARTYTLRKCDDGRKHDAFDLCMNPACCQGYVAPERLEEENREKIEDAVRETAGKVLTYAGELAEATYFSSSGGSTEDAVVVWGTDVPYLQATPSPGEADDFREDLYFSREELESALDLHLFGDPEDWVEGITYTEGGGVDTWTLSGEVFRGTEIRKALGLNSTCFYPEPMGDGLTISTVGFGHRVGMSQYGADAMAVSGETYETILTYYYRGTQVEDMNNLENIS